MVVAGWLDDRAIGPKAGKERSLGVDVFDAGSDVAKVALIDFIPKTARNLPGLARISCTGSADEVATCVIGGRNAVTDKGTRASGENLTLGARV